MALLPYVKPEKGKYRIGLWASEPIDLSIVVYEPNGSATAYLPPSSKTGTSIYEIGYRGKEGARKISVKNGEYFVFFEPKQKGKHTVKFVVKKNTFQLDFFTTSL